MKSADEADWKVHRRLFPALERCTYLNTANSGPVSAGAANAACEYYQVSSSDYDNTVAERWTSGIEAARSRVANLIGAGVDDIGFVPNTSMAMTCAALLFEGAGAVLTGRGEHPSVVTPWFARRFRVDVADPDCDGRLTVAAYARAIRPDTRVIAVSHVRYNDGQVNDLQGLGALARAHGAHLVVDATQSAGILPLRVHDGIDVLGFAAFKWLNAGDGSGAIYVRSGLMERYGLPIAGNRSRRMQSLEQINQLDPLLQPRAFELGTSCAPNLLALGAALEVIDGIGTAPIQQRVGTLTARLRCGLHSLRLATATDATADVLTPIVSVYVAQPEKTLAHLQERRINVSLRDHRIRIAVSWYNNEADIDRCLNELAGVR